MYCSCTKAFQKLEIEDHILKTSSDRAAVN